MRTTRRDILEEHGLTVAPRDVQNFFWRRYNARGRRPISQLGEIAGRIIARNSAAGPAASTSLSAAWRSVMPDAFAGRTEVEGFAGGRLRVLVDDAATKFVLVRQFSHELIGALNELLAPRQIKRIEYRIGRVQRRAVEEKEAVD